LAEAAAEAERDLTLRTRLQLDGRTHNLRAVQLLLGHRKLESTVRYLGIEVDDTLEMAERTEC
jgi:site-specific recombinase XerD